MNKTSTLQESTNFALKLIWFVLIVLPCVWLLIVSLKSYGITVPNDAPAWVQAVGSIAAIWGAFMVVNIQHNRAAADRMAADLRSKLKKKLLIARLAQDTYIHLGFLHNALEQSLADHGSPSLSKYVIEGNDSRWKLLSETLKSVVVDDLEGIQLMFLMDLKIACDFTMKLCSGLEQWNPIGDAERLKVIQVAYHLVRAETAYKLMAPLDPS